MTTKIFLFFTLENRLIESQILLREVTEFLSVLITFGARGSLVVKALRYKPAGRGFDSRWCHWNFSVT